MDIVDETLVRVKIIANLIPFQKLRINADNTIALDTAKNIVTAFSRWWSGDSRIRTLHYVRSVISDAIRMTRSLMEENKNTRHTDILRMFRDELTGSTKGMENLQRTYAGDVHVCSVLEVMKTTVQNHVERIEAFLDTCPLSPPGTCRDNHP